MIGIVLASSSSFPAPALARLHAGLLTDAYLFPGTDLLVERLRFGSLLRPPTYSVSLPNLARNTGAAGQPSRGWTASAYQRFARCARVAAVYLPPNSIFRAANGAH